MDIADHKASASRLLLEALDSGAFGDIEIFRSLEHVAREEGNLEPQGRFSESVEFAPENLPVPGFKTRGLIDRLASSLSDPTDQKAFILVATRIHAIVSSKTRPNNRMKVMAWIFGTGNDIADNPAWQLPGAVTFDDCERFLGFRAGVLRTRIIYQLFLDLRTLAKPFPFEVVDLPSTLESELFIDGGLKAIEAARHAWEWPGAPTASFDKIGITQEKLKSLVIKGYLGCHADSWFCIGRNPLIKPTHVKFNWGALWPAE